MFTIISIPFWGISPAITFFSYDFIVSPSSYTKRCLQNPLERSWLAGTHQLSIDPFIRGLANGCRGDH